MKTTRINARCPLCDSLIEASTSETNETPDPGDISICYHCGCMCIYTDAMGLRLPTGAEAKEILQNKEMVARLKSACVNMDRLVALARAVEGN